MKKSELRQIIREEIRFVLKEENELLKAQDACKKAMFDLKKEIDPILQILQNKGFVHSFGTRVEPYNNGYKLNFTFDQDYRKIDQIKDKPVTSFIYNTYSVFIQPGTFFQDKIDTGEGFAEMEGQLLSLTGKYSSFRYNIKSKSDIPLAIKKYNSSNSEVVRMLKNKINSL